MLEKMSHQQKPENWSSDVLTLGCLLFQSATLLWGGSNMEPLADVLWAGCCGR